ncbi:hypothetical protein HMP09_2319 [Sphingomonas sp. HMP9]|uniref:hypothetical protein n=1 Tax=Sphingomonas sp. HMP9 TaxID=1517554 RepID=UPI00159A73C5|nr:hypothetical protein [Sphingomonas sp. HMP9]BCA63085.1 hypothetical protein HMP09_2319 [Sphingomonas sp. HMP9]
MPPIDHIKRYLAGKTALDSFYDTPTNDRDLQAYLEQVTDIPPYTNDGDLLLYILNQNPAAAAADVNIKDALSKLLNGLSVEHQLDMASSSRYELVFDATPAWLSLPETYVTMLLATVSETGRRAARITAIKSNISEDFRYLKSSPKWLQEPAWMFTGDRPSIFIGQLDLADLLHDIAQVYMFFDAEDQVFSTVTQCF